MPLPRLVFKTPKVTIHSKIQPYGQTQREKKIKTKKKKKKKKEQKRIHST